MTAGQARPGCPPWCAEGFHGPDGFHISGGEAVTLAAGPHQLAGTLVAYVLQEPGGEPGVSLYAVPPGTGGALSGLMTCKAARAAACLAEMLAAASPQAHLEAAAVIRRAAALAGGGEG